MRVLVIGELHAEVTAATQIAQKHGAKVSHAPAIEAAMKQLLSGSGADIVLIDVQLDIEAFIKQLSDDHIHVPVVAFGINSDSAAAVRAIKAGAKEYLPLPPDEEMIAAILETIADESVNMIGNSDAMKQVIDIATRIAPSDANVLITGESGTGKEVMARFIHAKSKRSGKAFISVNCAAIPDNLLESELFGHEKGAFTGAANRRIGKFEESSGGTLLLDEISEMDIRLQAKLLRAIQEKEIDRVGGSKPVKVDLRVLATSNRDLQEEVKAGRFREDLLFRLNVIHLELPPLRKRPADIPQFITHFVGKYAAANDLPDITTSDAAMEKLTHYRWPGNVRELENTIHRAVLLATDNVIQPDNLLLQGAGAAPEGEQPVATFENSGNGEKLVARKVSDVEKELILNTLDHCLGNRTQAATILGISIRTLRNKLNQYSEGP